MKFPEFEYDFRALSAAPGWKPEAHLWIIESSGSAAGRSEV